MIDTIIRSILSSPGAVNTVMGVNVEYDHLSMCLRLNLNGMSMQLACSSGITDAELLYQCQKLHKYQHLKYQGALQNGLPGQSNQTVYGNSLGALAGATTVGNQTFPTSQGSSGTFPIQTGTSTTSLSTIQSFPIPTPASIVKPHFKNDGIKIGELVGWRAWTVTPEGFLKSLAWPTIWSPSEPMQAMKQDSASAANDAGLYAFKTESNVLNFLRGEGQVYAAVYGKVSLWGHIFEHELGYRAEFAKVLKILHAFKLGLPSALNPDTKTIPALNALYCH